MTAPNEQQNVSDVVTILTEQEKAVVETYLMNAVTTDMILEKIEWKEFKVVAKGHPRLLVLMTCRNPETQKSETAQFNALAIYRQIQKEQRYNDLKKQDTESRRIIAP